MKGRKFSKETFNRTAGVKPRGSEAKADSTPSVRIFERPMFSETMMEEVCTQSNLSSALKRVVSNKGAPGTDGMAVEDLRGYLVTSWPMIRAQLLAGKYQPRTIKRVEIPKPGSAEKRKLGIPCAIDRFIQQALLQVMQAQWDQFFSKSSFGFRPKKSAHQAILKAQEFVKQGHAIVVDIDLSKFFDRVCHDRLMSKLQRSIRDKSVLKLIRSYLTAGILENGIVSAPTEGTPQGGPLSPLLSNIVLDELDKELEKRGHPFVRYADDCNIYVKTPRAGERVMASITKFIESKLLLKVNEKKSAVDRPQNRKFLGFTFTGGNNSNRRKIHEESIARMKVKVRALTRRNQSENLEVVVQNLSVYLRGWKGYYGISEAPRILIDLDSWIRRKLRCIQWKQWKTYKRRKCELIKRGIGSELAHSSAWSAKGHWNICHTPAVRIALPNKYFDGIGLVRLSPK